MKLPPAKRIVRDLSVLLLACGAFYAVVVFVNSMQASGKEASAEDFSTERLDAEEAAAVKDWELTLVNLEQIIDRDPYDGRAQYLLAKTIFLQLVEAEEQLRALIVPSPAPAESDADAIDEPVANNVNGAGSPEALALEAEIAQLLKRGLKEFERAHQFLRYRVDSMEYLAKIHATMGQEEAALRYLRAYIVDEGRVTRRGLHRDPRYGEGMRLDHDMFSHHGRAFRLDSRYIRGLQFIGDWISKAPVTPTKLHRSEVFREIVNFERMNSERGRADYFRRR